MLFRSDICQCGFSLQNFIDFETKSELQCFDDSPNAITFRAELGGTAGANSSQIIFYLEQWITTSPTLVVKESRLAVDSMCNVEINHFNDTECRNEPTEKTPIVAVVVGGATGGVLMLLIIAVGTITVIFILKARSKKASKSYEVEMMTEYE